MKKLKIYSIFEPEWVQSTRIWLRRNKRDARRWPGTLGYVWHKHKIEVLNAEIKARKLLLQSLGR
jgi:hypothetical protein